MRQMKRLLTRGIDYIQIREKDLSTRELYELSGSIEAMARRTKTRILVKDRLDVALAAGLDGIHLGGTSAEIGVVRSFLAGSPMQIGVSTHSVEEVSRAALNGADYVTFGPVFSTPSKAAFGPPQGIEKLREAAKAVRIPVLALGGINRGNMQMCLDAGAAGIAAIRLFQDPDFVFKME